MDPVGSAGPRGRGRVVRCPRLVYSLRKRAGQELSLTPRPDSALPRKTEAPRGLKGRGKEHGLQKITEKAELSRLGSRRSGPPSQLSVKGEKSLHEKSPGKETPDEKITPLSESVTDDFEIDSSSDSELVSDLSLQNDVSGCVLNCSVTECYREYKSTEENLSSFSSPELVRGSDYFDWEHPKLEGCIQYKNSTLLDTSKAVAIELAPQLSDLSAILSTSSENNEKCHRKIVITLEDQNVSPKPKYTSNLVPDNAACEVVLTEKTGPPTSKKIKKKPEESEDRDPGIQTKLNAGHLKTSILLSHCKLALESGAGGSVCEAVLPPCLEPVLKKSSSGPDKHSKALLTSTPSSETVDFVIDLSPVQDVSFEEPFPKVSNYVNSNEIVSVSSSQENSSDEFPSSTSEICCIIRASPGTRQMKSKDTTIKKKYSLPKDTQDIIMKTDGRT